MRIAYLVILGLALGHAAFESAGVDGAGWNWSLVAVALSGLLCIWSAKRAGSGDSVTRWIRWPAIALPCYVLFQLVPLPLSALAFLAPAKAEMIRSAAGALALPQYAPLSVHPGETLKHLVRFSAYAVVIFTVPQMVWQSRRGLWGIAVPIIAVAALEAGLGLLQAGLADDEARGTYVNPGHFAGLLELALPFAVMFAITLAARARARVRFAAVAALLACLMILISAAIFLSVALSFSRMGFVACLLSLFLMAVLALAARGGSWRGWVAIVVVMGILTVSAFVYLAPDKLIGSFAKLGSPGGVTTEGRLLMWKETLPMIRRYAPFGCGAGAYMSGFFRFNVTSPTSTVDYSHNDYLQVLAELGPVGFAIIGTLVIAVVVQVIRAVVTTGETEGRHLALACAGSLGAILVHSLVDFNSYVPANGLLLAWILGISAGLVFLVPANRVWEQLGLPLVVEVAPYRR